LGGRWVDGERQLLQFAQFDDLGPVVQQLNLYGSS